VPKWIRAASTKIDDAGCKDLGLVHWDKRLLSVGFPADTWLRESNIQRSDFPGERMLYRRHHAPYGQSIFPCPHPKPSLARLVVEKEEEEPLDLVRWRVIIMRWRTSEIKVLSVLPLSSLDSNKDAHSVCVASRCQGRLYWTGRTPCSWLKRVPLQNG
jgi:hypothetical protein